MYKTESQIPSPIVRSHIVWATLAIAIFAGGCAAQPDIKSPTTLPTDPGERVPSEDSVIKSLHSMGLLCGHTNVFRSACPVRDLAKSAGPPNDHDKLASAEERIRHLRELGVRTIISFEDSQKPDSDDASPATGGESKTPRAKASVALERSAAEHEGIRFQSIPMRNSGVDSLQDMTDGAVLKQLDTNANAVLKAAEDGGVLFHCSGGHDRAGIVAAYFRVKYQHWPVEEAIAEMRRDGHNWQKYSNDGGKSSWHETHLRAIAKMIGDNSKESETILSRAR